MIIKAHQILAAGALVLAVALPAAADDQTKLATEKGCTACHAVDKKVIGPAYKEVAKKYKSDAKAADTLAAKVVKGGSGVWGPIPLLGIGAPENFHPDRAG